MKRLLKTGVAVLAALGSVVMSGCSDSASEESVEEPGIPRITRIQCSHTHDFVTGRETRGECTAEDQNMMLKIEEVVTIGDVRHLTAYDYYCVDGIWLLIDVLLYDYPPEG